MSHASFEQLGELLAGSLSPSNARALETHLAECVSCRQQANELVFQRGGLTTTIQNGQGKMNSALLPARVGDLIDSRYRLIRVLGMGGMGCVFEAHQMHLNQKVALKLMLAHDEGDDSASARFIREARSAAHMVTEHVCRVLDVGTLPNRTPFIAMEYLRGETLQERLDREVRIPWSQTRKMILEVVEALEEAHGLGIVHRDLKPANLFLAQRPGGKSIVKVLDFGIAKSVHPEIESGLSATTTNRMLGTPRYMAPEQMAGKSDARTDLWAVGCILHQMLAGEAPFEGTTAMEVLFAINNRPHRMLAPSLEVPAEVQAIIDGCLAKSPSSRFATVKALREAILKAPEEFTRAPMLGDDSALSDSPTDIHAEVLAPARQRRRALGVFAALALFLVGGWLALGPQSKTEKSPKTPLPQLERKLDIQADNTPVPTPSRPAVRVQPEPGRVEANAPAVAPPLVKKVPTPAAVRPKPRPQRMKDNRVREDDILEGRR